MRTPVALPPSLTQGAAPCSSSDAVSNNYSHSKDVSLKRQSACEKKPRVFHLAGYATKPSQGTPSGDRLSHKRVAAVSRTSSAHVKDYRAFLLDEDGHIISAHALDAVDDDEALQKATCLVDGRDVEVWQLARKVGLIKTATD
ncbi:hypothetical protein ABIF65_006618 [Bradyrhizobium japonicum]|jgi:hypothetical protein